MRRLKYIPYILCLTLLLSSCFSTQQDGSMPPCDYQVKVVGISDGDTFRGLTNDNTEIRYRVYGIDAPEKKQAYGEKSKQYLSSLIYGKTVGIKVKQERDIYGRPVVIVFTPDGKDISAEMLKAGMAWHYFKYDNTSEYKDLEQEARRAKIGLWQDKNPIEPWVFRKIKPKKGNDAKKR